MFSKLMNNPIFCAAETTSWSIISDPTLNIVTDGLLSYTKACDLLSSEKCRLTCKENKLYLIPWIRNYIIEP